MQSQDAPFHAHVYYTPETREAAVALHSRLLSAMTIDRSSGLIFVGQMRDYKVGPHPDPQFEVHFLEADLNKIVPVLKSSALTVLVHPLTRDDLADHTTLAHWIGDPIPLDLTTLDPPGVNQGLARFGKTDVQQIDQMRTARTLMSNVEAVEATKQLRNTRPGGHRIENAPLIEYQMSPFAPAS